MHADFDFDPDRDPDRDPDFDPDFDFDFDRARHIAASDCLCECEGTPCRTFSS